MKNKSADLHIHSRYSDGTYRASEIFRIAKKNGFKAISITDHDCIDVYKEAVELSKNYGIEFIQGVELSSEYDNYDIHILGYFIDVKNDILVKSLDEFSRARIERAKKIVELLNTDGIDISFEDVMKISPNGTVARPHIAQLLLDKGYAYSFQEAFAKFLNTNSKYYIKKFKISPEQAIDLIHRSGGLAFLAHPVYLKDDPDMINVLIESGLDGIETVHSSYSEDFLKLIDKIADDYKLLKSGGSDCHGKMKTGKRLLGQYSVPYSYIESMKDKLNEEKR
ncbi:MAG: PHP domain-containing protein [Candidatus Delongbacteria bacterium]|nr:PHP domain-containing protein [Candidatus Delongbacteria bacterium]MCG2759898.1 PHP domain-containing protein [Candidatus Delongbacteria bacterium]